MKVKTRVSLYQPPVKFIRENPTHVGVQVDGVSSKDLSAVPNILRDTFGNPIWDTGYSILTAPTLASGIRITVA